MPPNQAPPSQPRPSPQKWKQLLFWAPALFVLLLALSLAIISNSTSPHLTTLPLLRSLPFLKPTLFLTLLSPTKSKGTEALPPISERPPCVRWMAPFLSGGGYSSEAWSYITALHTHVKDPKFKLKIDQHGDLESIDFWLGLPEESKALAYELYSTECELSNTIVICHSEPGAWFPPLFQTPPCPPTGYGEPMFVVGRTMFETDRVAREHVRRCNAMGAVWVPTDFHLAAFVRSGVDPSKVAKIVQPVDVDFFDPSKHEALALPTKNPIFSAAAPRKTPPLNPMSTEKGFVFLSVFKWEHRKGWDVLLRAFLEEFSYSDGVALYLLISAYHSDADFIGKITNFVEEMGLKEPSNGWARVYAIDTHIPQSDLPRLYRAADAFVLPSRGEGWGRPIVEAMAMGLPVIATNWSGPTEYLTEENGYPLRVERMGRVRNGPFAGHLWAEPSVDGLRLLMRRVATDRDEGRRKGGRAREDMIRRFSPEVVAGIVAEEIDKLSKSASRKSSVAGK
uniref:Uncharacterized protein n=1 Tax=Ananas comosus var. bracteatus TaxID=296719 RepID=A0A6V7QWH9_ANACO